MKTISIFLILLALLLPTAVAQVYTDLELAQAFAPVLKFNGGELFYVAPVSYHVYNSDLMQYADGPVLIDSNPSPDSISIYEIEANNYYLDNQLGWFEQILTDYSQAMGGLTPTIYAHVVRDDQYTSIQYWFFYAFNNGPLNEHEGDWEMIEVLLNGTVPEWAIYSQHHSASRLSWGEVDKIQNTHPVVYVARGSHANYFRPFEGRFGIQNDEVGGDGFTLTPEQIDIVLLEDPDAETQNSWLKFGGRWGDWGGATAGIRGGRGPFGPASDVHSEAWYNPVSWAMSVPITGGSWFLFSWIVYHFVLLFLVYILVRTVWKAFGIYRLARGSGLQVGSLLKSSFTIWLILGILGTVLVLVGIVTPWYTVVGDVQSQEIQTAGPVDLIKFNGMDGLQVNTLEKDEGMTSLFNFAVPFGFILLAGIIFTVLDIIGVKNERSLGAKYMLGGILPIIFFIAIIVGISSLTSLLPNISPILGEEGVPAETAALISTIAGSPFSGGYSGPMGGYANLSVSWGLGIGAYLILIGGLMRIFAGVAMMAGPPKSRLQQQTIHQQPVGYLPPHPQQVQQQVAPQQPQETTHKPAQKRTTHKKGSNSPNFCHKCGKKIEKGTTFCHACGTKLDS